MAASALKLMNEYGDREFGDEWWPLDARAWLGEERAVRLARQLRDPRADIAETAILLGEYAEAKFGPKWRPWDAVGVLEEEDASELAVLLSGLGTSPQGAGLRSR